MMDDIIVGAVVVGVVNQRQGGHNGRRHVEGETMGNVVFGKQQ